MLTNTLDWMPAKPLTPEQKADAERLRKAFHIWQAAEEDADRPHSQAEAAFRLGFGQSALSQYLRGFIPLNAKALMKLCMLMGIRAEDISPAIVEEERRRAMAWYEVPGEAPAPPPTVGAKLIKSGKMASPYRVIAGSHIKPAKSKDTAKTTKPKR